MGKQRRGRPHQQSRPAAPRNGTDQRPTRRRVDIPAQWRDAASAGAFDDLDETTRRRPPRSRPGDPAAPARSRLVPRGPGAGVVRTIIPDEHKQPDRPAHADDIKTVGYGPGDEPVVPERFKLLPVRHEQSGNQGSGFNPELRTPEPATVYVVDHRFVYVTDTLGRVVHAEGWLGWERAADSQRRRDHTAQKTAGGPDRQTFDQGGHLIAAKFSGPGEGINITAQSNVQNNSQRGTTLDTNYGRLEEHWFALRVDGVPVHASIDVQYPGASSLRPSSRTVVDRHQGHGSPIRVFKEKPPSRTTRAAVAAVAAQAGVYAAAVTGVAPSTCTKPAARPLPAHRPRTVTPRTRTGGPTRWPT